MGRGRRNEPGGQRMTITITQYGDSSNVLDTPTVFFAFGTVLVGTASAPLDPGQYTNIIFGDYFGLTGHAAGGRDTLTGGEGSFNTLYGDAFFISGHAVGNGDLLVAGLDAMSNTLIGDADNIIGFGRGGGDSVYGADHGFTNTLIGDANSMTGNAIGGRDQLFGGAISGSVGTTSGNLMYGDALDMTGQSVGGRDKLVGGVRAFNTLHGDAFTMGDSVIGGADTLVRPYFIARGAQLPFLLTMLGVLGGALSFGLLGIFLGPVLLGVGYALVNEWADREVRPLP